MTGFTVGDRVEWCTASEFVGTVTRVSGTNVYVSWDHHDDNEPPTCNPANNHRLLDKNAPDYEMDA